MSRTPAAKPPSSRDSESFEILLRRLDHDREKAGHRYEEIRGRLIDFFSWECVAEAEALADETLNRLSSKLAAGTEVVRVEAYLHGIARLVLKEALRERDRRRRAVDGRAPTQAPPSRAAPESKDDEDERAQDCLDSCLDRLPAEARRLILAYYRGEKGAKLANRAALAGEWGISANALRNRALRLRIGLEKCVRQCIAGGEERDDLGPRNTKE